MKPGEARIDQLAGISVPETVRVEARTFTDVPDWVAQDQMFLWAKESGDIEVVAEIAMVGASGADPAKEEKKDPAKDADPAKAGADLGLKK